MSERTPKQIIGSDALIQLAFEGYAVVPVEPTQAMIKAAAKSMSPGRRPTPERVSVKQKHAIRFRAMISAALSEEG